MRYKNRPLEIKKSAVTQQLNVAFEVKQIEDDDDEFFFFEGLASTFSLDLGKDIVEPGAFVESLAVKTPIILWQHRQSEPIGMPVEVRETSEGLFLRAKLPKSDDLVKGRVIPQIKVGSVRTMSIGFRTLEDARDLDDPSIRRIKQVDLIEVSLVTFPMNPGAVVTGFKSLEEEPLTEDEIKHILDLRANGAPTPLTVDTVKQIKTRRDYEKTLRESGGFSKDAAVIMAKHFQGEPDESEELKAIRKLSANIEEQKTLSLLSSMSKNLESHNV